MSKKMLIDATHPEETRVVVVDGTKVEEFDFETINKRQLAGNIYLAKVTRVEPSLQAAFVDYGGNRHGFLAFAEIHPDYYQIPAADRQALIAEEQADEAEAEEQTERRNSRRRRPARAERAVADEVATSDEIPGMEMLGDSGSGQAEGAAVVATPEAAAEGVDSTAAAQAGGGDASGDNQAGDHADDHSDARDNGDDHDGDDSDGDDGDDSIESVGQDDSGDDLRRPVKRTRARRYKIQEVVKVRQIMLVQVVKEERGNKGAALTTYLSLAGRYCVLMPNTARGGGISRKITNIADRKKLKDIASELEVPQGAGLIIRTAGSQRTRMEIRRDYEYLMRLWEQIRELTFKSVAPAPIYEEGDLIKRTIRDLYSKEIEEVLVEGERGYRTAKDFMAMIMPSHARNVKHYVDPMPLFSRHQIESYLGGMFNPTVQLKSGGYIVIGVTEALVAIDVNSGRATKEGSIEETAYKTNCEAADEIARQLRLRDLAGLIVIDFIDMDERKHNLSVEKRFKERLKTDRARIQVGRISGFGLMEMSRQRLRPGMLESTTQPCAHCHGTGLIRSDDSLALTILRAIEEEGTRKRSREVLVKAPVAVVNFLMNAKREHIANIEARYGMSVRVEADPALISPDFALEKFKTATRLVPEVTSNVVSVDARLMAQIDDEDNGEDQPDDTPEEDVIVEARADTRTPDEHEEEGGEDGNGRTRRRRRRRRRGGRGDDDLELEAGDGNGADGDSGDDSDDGSQNGADQPDAEAASAAGDGITTGAAGDTLPPTDGDAAPSRPARRTRTRRRRADDVAADVAVDSASSLANGQVAVTPAEQVVAGSDPVAEAVAEEPAIAAMAGSGDPAPTAALAMPGDTAPEDTPPATAEAEPETAPQVVPALDAEAAPAPVPAPAADPVAQPEPRPEVAAPVADDAPAKAAEPQPALAETAAEAPKRRGWWSA